MSNLRLKGDLSKAHKKGEKSDEMPAFGTPYGKRLCPKCGEWRRNKSFFRLAKSPAHAAKARARNIPYKTCGTCRAHNKRTR